MFKQCNFVGLFQYLIVFQLQKSDVYSFQLSYAYQGTTVPVHNQYHDFNEINVSNLELGPPAKIHHECEIHLTLQNNCYKKYTLKNIDSVPENIHDY